MFLLLLLLGYACSPGCPPLLATCAGYFWPTWVARMFWLLFLVGLATFAFSVKAFSIGGSCFLGYLARFLYFCKRWLVVAGLALLKEPQYAGAWLLCAVLAGVF